MSRFTTTSRTVPARFLRIGTAVSGTVLSITEVPVPEFVDGKPVGPKTDLNGVVLTQVDIVLDADGIKTLVHARGGIAYAIASYLEDSPLDDVNEGDFLSIKYVANEDMGEGLDPAKVYEVKIVPASDATPEA